MSNVAISFASIVKSNNGFFKSEAQAKFLLSQCQEENTFIAGGTVYRNSYQLFYVCDACGVIRVDKYLATSGKTETTFNRLSSEAFETKQIETAARQQRNAIGEAESLAKFQARQEAFDNALAIAKAFIKTQMLSAGSSESIADSAVNMIIKDQDSVANLMEDLVKSPEFIVAWETYNSK